MDTEKNVVTAAAQTLSELGAAKGGRARAKALNEEERREIARKAAEARWGSSSSIKKETHNGILRIGEREIACAVLEGGIRVLSTRGFNRAMGARTQGTPKGGRTGARHLPAFMASKNLESFISEDLRSRVMSPIKYRPIRGEIGFGHEATILPDACKVILDANRAGALKPTQLFMVEAAESLLQGLAKVGIIALVDEATGYQEVREREALQAILDAFLRKELAAWASRFPSEFYQEIFRLNGWEWNKLSTKRPRMVGKLTKDVIYERLAPGIIEELEKRNPRNANWYRKDRHHQWLTDDVGVAALAQHLHAVIAFMRVSKTWEQFYKMLNQAFPKRNDTLALPFMTDVSS